MMQLVPLESDNPLKHLPLFAWFRPDMGHVTLAPQPKLQTMFLLPCNNKLSQATSGEMLTCQIRQPMPNLKAPATDLEMPHSGRQHSNVAARLAF